MWPHHQKRLPLYRLPVGSFRFEYANFITYSTVDRVPRNCAIKSRTRGRNMQPVALAFVGTAFLFPNNDVRSHPNSQTHSRERWQVISSYKRNRMTCALAKWNSSSHFWTNRFPIQAYYRCSIQYSLCFY